MEPAWYPAAADLGPWAGRKVTLRFITSPWYGRLMCDFAYWGDPRVVSGDALADPGHCRTVLRLCDAFEKECSFGWLFDGKPFPAPLDYQFEQNEGHVSKALCEVPGKLREGFFAPPGLPAPAGPGLY